MDKARIEELVGALTPRFDPLMSSDVEALRAALIVLARECFKDAAKEADDARESGDDLRQVRDRIRKLGEGL